MFQISEVVITINDNGQTFIIAKLLFNDEDRIYWHKKPISAGLHMTLVNCEDPEIFNLPMILAQITNQLNAKLNGKFIKIADKNGEADLEFGRSGQSWRIRAGEKIELTK